MRAIMVMFDSLNRHMLPPYGYRDIVAPNFERLAEKTAVFDNCYAGSLPCMPARREIHTGRYNFLHRSWGPLEPYDDSMPQILKENGIYTHLTTDHWHYWEEGGNNYQTKYNTFEFVRGQEGDCWKPRLKWDVPPHIDGRQDACGRQEYINRWYMREEKDQSIAVNFSNGLEFIENNHEEDNWFLQLENFDPHEPFFTPQKYKDYYKDGYDGPMFDWPGYHQVRETPEQVNHCINEYKALVTMCDTYLGKLLDYMDAHDMWNDTMLIVATDHGFLLGEHGWWAKNRPPFYEELSHTPLFIWDPREKIAGERRNALVQTIDLAPTLLGLFGIRPAKDMQGCDLHQTIRSDKPVRTGALFGMFGAHICVTDGRYVYMRADRPGKPLYDYTLLPLHQRAMYAPEELQELTLQEPFSFTKGCKTLKIAMPKDFYPCMSVAKEENADLLFDLQDDPQQMNPLEDKEAEQYMIGLMRALMQQNDAPAEQYLRVGLQLP